MAKKINPSGHRTKREIPRVELIPVQEIALSDPMRIKEIGDIVASIILLGRTRRKIRENETEVFNAA